MIQEYKINLHITEHCNYHCKHCFAHFNSTSDLTFEQWKIIIDNCCNNINVSSFNIAGGEPFLYKSLDKLAKYIISKNKKCSIITNGSLMDFDWISENAKYYYMIGFSIDSFSNETLINIGRCNSKLKTFDAERFYNICTLIKESNPECCIKINTVVTKLNYKENLVHFISDKNIPVSRWKHLKIKKFVNEKFDNSDICISQNEYEYFIKNNSAANLEIIHENDLKNSYIIIDACGTLVDNSNDDYIKIGSCLKENFGVLFSKMPFNESLYNSRYAVL